MNPAELPLRDIHLPEAVGWWPPAPGWWILASIVLASIGLASFAWRRRAAWRRSALYVAHGELAGLRAAWLEHGDGQRLAREVSTWLRRVVISVRSREQAAALTGAQWWRYLDELAGQPVFGPDGGQMITEAPYKMDSAIDGQALVTSCERWLAAVGNRRGQTA